MWLKSGALSRGLQVKKENPFVEGLEIKMIYPVVTTREYTLPQEKRQEEKNAPERVGM